MMNEKNIENCFVEKKSITDFSSEECEEVLKRSNKLGKAGGELFNDLTRESLYEPDSKDMYKPDRKARGSIDFDDINKHRIEKREFLEKYSPGIDKFFSYPEADGVIQKRERIYAQEEETNVIEEKIYNYVKNNPDDRIVRSELLIRNRESGLSLDFSQLIPDNHSFIPAALVEKARMKKVDLEVYKNKNDDDEFWLDYLKKQIVYGDLTKKGKIISLFHEIAHSWQMVYHHKSPIYEYQNFIDSVLDKLSRLRYTVNSKEQTEIQKENAEFLQELLRKMGVNLDPENFYKGGEPEKGQYKLFNPADNNYYIIESDKLEELIKKYQYEERNAWAHAIKMLRFFRKNDFDLEPGLQTIGEIEEYIYDCLDSYQKSAEKIIYRSDKKVKFL